MLPLGTLELGELRTGDLARIPKEQLSCPKVADRVSSHGVEADLSTARLFLLTNEAFAVQLFTSFFTFLTNARPWLLTMALSPAARAFWLKHKLAQSMQMIEPIGLNRKNLEIKSSLLHFSYACQRKKKRKSGRSALLGSNNASEELLRGTASAHKLRSELENLFGRQDFTGLLAVSMNGDLSLSVN